MIYLFIDSIATITTHYPVGNAVLDIYVNNVHQWIPNYDYLHRNIVSDNEGTPTKYPSPIITTSSRTTGTAAEVTNLFQQILFTYNWIRDSNYSYDTTIRDSERTTTTLSYNNDIQTRIY